MWNTSISLPLYPPVTGKITINVLKHSKYTRGRVPSPSPKHTIFLSEMISINLQQQKKEGQITSRPETTYKLSLYVFLLFFGIFGFFTVFCTFLFSIKTVFGFFLVTHYFCLVLRFLFNCFWSRDLRTSGLWISHLTLRPPFFMF